jgi:hypothetical protein
LAHDWPIYNCNKDNLTEKGQKITGFAFFPNLRSGQLIRSQWQSFGYGRLTHAAYIWPKSQRNPAQKLNLDRLASILAIPKSDLEKRINEADENPSTLIRIARGLTWPKLSP